MGDRVFFRRSSDEQPMAIVPFIAYMILSCIILSGVIIIFVPWRRPWWYD
jgi:hypothetical protein